MKRGKSWVNSWQKWWESYRAVIDQDLNNLERDHILFQMGKEHLEALQADFTIWEKDPHYLSIGWLTHDIALWEFYRYLHIKEKITARLSKFKLQYARLSKEAKPWMQSSISKVHQREVKNINALLLQKQNGWPADIDNILKPWQARRSFPPKISTLARD